MSRALTLASLVLAAILFMNSPRVDAQPEQKKPEGELIPAPKVVLPPTVIIEPLPQRSDTREVWQHYGVNSFGRFVPRVIRTPFGDYYSRNLEPYPWANNHPRSWLP
jgi:hypothetical protein